MCNNIYDYEKIVTFRNYINNQNMNLKNRT